MAVGELFDAERIGLIEARTKPRTTHKRFLEMLDWELVRRRQHSFSGQPAERDIFYRCVFSSN